MVALKLILIQLSLQMTPVFTVGDLQRNPHGMPGERIASTMLDVGHRRVQLQVEVTAKGNGHLKGPGLDTKVYDGHDDGTLYEPPLHRIVAADVNGDRAADLVILGVVARTSDDNRPLGRELVLQVWLFDPQTGEFSPL